MKNIKVKEIVFYSGHGITANGSVSLKFKAPYSELVNTINTMQMLNNDISIKAKLPGEPVKKLGVFRIKSINIDNDGESTIKFDSLNTFVEVDNLNAIVSAEPFQVLMEANIELEEVDGTEV